MTLLPPLPLRPLLHSHYLNMRALWRCPDMPRRGVQKGFEELLYSVLGPDSWRPTHISPAAVRALLADWPRRGSLVQRAHGVLPGRVDRNVRTAGILEGPELPFEAWWGGFVRGDSTVLITREEHSGGRAMSAADLIPLPSPSEGLFVSAGFGVSLRRGREGEWLKWVAECYNL